MCGFDDDIYLDHCKQHQRVRVLGGFAQAMQEARFSGPSHETLVETTIRNAISYVAIGGVLPSTKTDTLQEFYLDSSEHTEIKTPQ